MSSKKNKIKHKKFNKTWKELDKQWKILIISLIGTTILAVFGPIISDYIKITFFSNEETSDPYVFIFRQDWSDWVGDLTNETGRCKIIIVPINASKSVENPWVPLSFFHWDLPKNHSLFVVSEENRGEIIESKTRIVLSFTPNLITKVELTNSEKVKILRGGKGSSLIEISIDDLFPNEMQGFSLIVESNKLKSFEAWSETQKTIDNIFYYQIIFEPNA
jgi:hypothetical protein